MTTDNPPDPMAVAQELADLRKLSGDHGSDYWRGPWSTIHQRRHLELIEAEIGNTATKPKE